ncbi:hypothetical protein Scep_026657 [Stephania cephalantha]|uniref:Uncharacterized protein n=1 Tax=Stephania cephalantha TaxID=152367 RepID=A0AAP0HND2_9MAGN
MDRWRGVLRVSLNPNVHFRIAASLRLSSSSKTLIVPSANAIFFNGDRVEQSGNPVIERLSNMDHIADVLVSKLGISINALVIEASTFNGPFAVYKEFIPSVNSFGEPKFYSPDGFPASSSILLLLSKCLDMVSIIAFPSASAFPLPGINIKWSVGGSNRQVKSEVKVEPSAVEEPASSPLPETIVLGFSKGGVVLNQLLTELAHLKPESPNIAQQCSEGNSSEVHSENFLPSSKDCFLNSISEVHYVDVGLNSTGAYLCDKRVVEKIAERVAHGAPAIGFALHGTPRQWCDRRRLWIHNEKNILIQLLQEASRRTSGKIRVCERFYFADMSPNLQMHFEIIENMELML